ncbi:hypothetical protein Tco_1244917 [Tanacetum coccineum]
MTKVIKGEFKKIKDVKVEDVSLTCYTLLEVFNNEVNRLRGMDDDLFTMKKLNVSNYHVTSKIDDSEYEADDDIGFEPSDVAFTEWLGSKGDDEVELTDEESSDDDDEIAEVFGIDTNIFDYETPLYSAFNEFNYLLKVDPDLLTKDIMGFKTYMKIIKTTGYMNGTRIDNMNEELCEVHELPVCNIRRFEMIKYSFGQDEEYVAIKEDEYDDFERTSKDAYRAYQEIFRLMDEGWMVTRAE